MGFRPYSETYSAYDTLAGTDSDTAGAEIVGIDVPDTGIWMVEVYHKINSATTPATSDNLAVMHDGAEVTTIMHIAAVSNSTALDTNSPHRCFVRANEGERISVNYKSDFGSSEVQTHAVNLQITRVAD